MIEIDKPNIEIVDLSTQGSRSVGRFVVEPLERGFGTTLGNGIPLRLMVFCTNFQLSLMLKKM